MYTLTLELELGRLGAPQPTHEGAAHRLGIWARGPEGPPHTRLDGAQGDPLPVTPDEQRHVGTANGKDRAALRISQRRGSGPAGYRGSFRSP